MTARSAGDAPARATPTDSWLQRVTEIWWEAGVFLVRLPAVPALHIFPQDERGGRPHKTRLLRTTRDAGIRAVPRPMRGGDGLRGALVVDREALRRTAATEQSPSAVPASTLPVSLAAPAYWFSLLIEFLLTHGVHASAGACHLSR